ncbi:MAG: DUF1330 domain-containing protein [Hyphomicrobiales bacterium]
MPKGYWIVRVDVTDPEGYKKYLAANGAAFAKYGARFIVRAGPFDVLEGSARSRNVVIEFPSVEQARACYHSAEYAPALAFRQDAATADLIIIEGYDGPQPGET